MRLAFLCLVVLAGCRTPPLDGSLDGLSAPADGAAGDASTVPTCPFACDRTINLCVFINRGDCSDWKCVPRPADCMNPPSCACLGPGFCARFAMGGETFTCEPPEADFGDDLVCLSSSLCI